LNRRQATVQQTFEFAGGHYKMSGRIPDKVYITGIISVFVGVGVIYGGAFAGNQLISAAGAAVVFVGLVLMGAAAAAGRPDG